MSAYESDQNNLSFGATLSTLLIYIQVYIQTVLTTITIIAANGEFSRPYPWFNDKIKKYSHESYDILPIRISVSSLCNRGLS